MTLESGAFTAVDLKQYKTVKTSVTFILAVCCVVKEPLICFNQLCSAEGLPKDCVCVSVMDREGESDKARPTLKGVQFPCKCMLTRLIEHCKW